MKLLGAFIGAALVCATAIGDAKAGIITGGSTVIQPVVSLDRFDVELLGDAEAGLLFPITGGTLDENLAGRIEHEGSGLRFGRNGNTLDVENFIIDTTAGVVLGDVSANGALVASDATLFNLAVGGLSAGQITDLGNPMIGLRISETAIGAFRDVLGVGFGHNTLFANAATAPQFAQVPAPGGLALILGVLGIGATRRRRNRTALTA